jgi:sugar lactone lactonase YvrE
MMKTSSKARLFGFGLATLMLTGAAHAGATEIWRTTGFSSPESVAWDAAAGLFYVSNMGADPMAADGDGYISTLGADGKVIADKWATGMNAPKGLAAVGGKLYTADLTDLVEIDTATGAITNRYPAAGAVFLNDVVAAPDGRIFVSDTFGNSVWVLENGAMSLFAQDPMLLGANGLTVIGNALIVADLGDASQGFDKIKPGMVVSIDLTSKVITPYGSTEPSGVLDGVEADGKGGVLFTDNMGGRLMQQSPGGAAAEVAKLEPGAADMAVVLDQGLILVPLTPANTVVGLKWTE